MQTLVKSNTSPWIDWLQLPLGITHWAQQQEKATSGYLHFLSPHSPLLYTLPPLPTGHLLSWLQATLSSSSSGVSAWGCPAQAKQTQCVKHRGINYTMLCPLTKLRDPACKQTPALKVSWAVWLVPGFSWNRQKALCWQTVLGSQSCEDLSHRSAGAAELSRQGGCRHSWITPCYSRLHPWGTLKCSREKWKDGIYVLNSAADNLDKTWGEINTRCSDGKGLSYRAGPPAVPVPGLADQSWIHQDRPREGPDGSCSYST